MNLKSLIAAPPSGRTRPLLIDDIEYSTAVVRQGSPVPWTDSTLLAAHMAQVGGLLNPDAVWVDIRAMLEAHLRLQPQVVAAMSARSRIGYPLRVILGTDEITAAVTKTIATAATVARRPVLLSVPSPAALLQWAHEQTGTPLDVVDPDRADNASIYLAEWLGRLGELPIALVLIDARAATIPEHVNSYSSITNVAGHFDWSVGLQNTAGIDGGDGPSISVVPGEFWTGQAPAPAGDVLLAKIAGSAMPEQVLERLSTLS